MPPSRENGSHVQIVSLRVIIQLMDAKFNPDKQHTLKQAVSISGTGLHTGIMVDMTLRPANAGYGFQFQRIDLAGRPLIKADCDLVTDTSRGTTLEDNGPESAQLNIF